jgi:hypothetical protein
MGIKMFYVTKLMALLSVLFCFACEENIKPSISENTFQNILIDIHLKESRIGKYQPLTDSIYYAAGSAYNEIYKKHKVNAKQFKQTFEYYEQNPKKFEKIYETIVEKLSEQEAKLKD